MQGIYRIKNKLNEKYCIGSSIDIARRWNEHRRALEDSNHWNVHLQRAWNKHGKENFIFEAVEEIENEKALRVTEQKYLDEGFELGVLYNIAKEAIAPMRGRKHTEEFKHEQSERMCGEGNPFYGKHHTKETKDRMRDVWTPRRREKQSQQMIGKTGKDHPAYGYHHTDEAILKLKGSWTPERRRKAKEWWTPERRKEQSKQISGENHPLYGTHHTEEWKRNHSRWMIENAPMRGKTHSDELKQELSLRWAGEGNPNYGKDMSGENNPFYGKHHTEEHKRQNAESSAKLYPAFYNIKTGDFIPAGHNLLKCCRAQNLNYESLRSIKCKSRQKSHVGWRLATQSEIEKNDLRTV